MRPAAVPVTHTVGIRASKADWHHVPMLSAPDLLIHRLEGPHGFTAVVHFPAGWIRESAVTCSEDETFVVLDGTLTLNGMQMGSASLGHVPAGSARVSTHSAHGCTAVAWFSGVPRWAPATADDNADVAHYPLRAILGGSTMIVGRAQWILHDPLTDSAVDVDSELIDLIDGTWSLLGPGQSATPSPHRHVRRLHPAP